METDIQFRSHLAQFFLEWEMFQTNVVEKLETHVMLYRGLKKKKKSCHLWDNLKKFCIAGQVTEDSTAHAHCMLDTYGNKHAHTIYRVSIKSFLDYKHLLQENYVEYRHISLPFT
jgi:hypothetical protein